MDPEHTFIRVQERFSQMLTPRIRVALEYMYLFMAVSLFCILVVMHANYVHQPGCSRELYMMDATDARLMHVKISSAASFLQEEPKTTFVNAMKVREVIRERKASNVDGNESQLMVARRMWNWVGSQVRRGKLAFEFWKTGTELLALQGRNSTTSRKVDGIPILRVLTKKYFKAAVIHFLRKWCKCFLLLWGHATQIFSNFQKLKNMSVIHLNFNIPRWWWVLQLEKMNVEMVRWLDRRVVSYEPVYLYTKEKGYLLLPESARVFHNVKTVNATISSRHPCFGNRWQRLLINRAVGYDTILMNSLLSAPGQGYLYNYQTKELFNLSFSQQAIEGSPRFGDYLVNKCGVLMMSLFVFFTTTMSVSFTLRETQTRMLKFTVQLQHHARRRLPTFQLIFVHVVESLVFVPIMIGILFFLFEFYDDHLLAFMVLVLVWLCELFTLVSVRTPISMKFFPRFFLLYFLVFHIYFFSYANGFTYLALMTSAAFMQHLILYFWNRFEIPALQRFLQSRRSQQQPNFQITSTILASTLHITRLNGSGEGVAGGNGHTQHHQEGGQQGNNNNNSLSSLLLWILGGATHSIPLFSIFRDNAAVAEGVNSRTGQVSATPSVS